jgi:hypothetical protein
MPIIEDDSPDPSLIPTPKPERPSWMESCNVTTKVPYPPGFKPPTGNPMGNPNFTPGSLAAHEAGVKYSFKPGHDPNRPPGHKVKLENRSIRKALIRLVNEPVLKQSKLRTKADEVAHRLYELSQSSNGRDALAAIREIIDRVDGKSAPSVQELNAIKDSGSKVIMIDTSMRPNRSSEPHIIEHQRPVLGEPELNDEDLQ